MASGGTTAPADVAARFAALSARPSSQPPDMPALEAFFDTLPAISPEEMIGNWRGGVFPVGGLYDFLLRPKPIVRWHGKRFHSENRVQALLCKLFGLVVPLPLGRARLRKIEYRGLVSTAMIYDRLPIIDHFRQVDADTVMGLMETRGKRGAAFYLQRERP